jgi:hypothetical protein
LKVFFHSGELGDIIASLPVIRALGGGCLVIGQKLLPRFSGTRGMNKERFQAISPLLARVPYLSDVRYDNCPGHVDYDFSLFRPFLWPSLLSGQWLRLLNPKNRNENIVLLHARHAGLNGCDLSPWLHIEPSAETRGRIVVARSLRHQNPQFPWGRFAEQYSNRWVFVGLPEEHQAFQDQFGRIEHKPTADLLEVARLIAGSELFIDNQTSSCWIAMGLGHPLIQEVSPACPNSIIARPNATFLK